MNEFSRQLEKAVRDAQAEGAIDPSEDAEQLAFELGAYLSLANAQFAVSQESAPIDRARRALEVGSRQRLRPDRPGEVERAGADCGLQSSDRTRRASPGALKVIAKLADDTRE